MAKIGYFEGAKKVIASYLTNKHTHTLTHSHTHMAKEVGRSLKRIALWTSRPSQESLPITLHSEQVCKCASDTNEVQCNCCFSSKCHHSIHNVHSYILYFHTVCISCCLVSLSLSLCISLSLSLSLSLFLFTIQLQGWRKQLLAWVR